jgi:hypothetical protein
MKVPLTQSPDVLGEIQVQSRNPARGKKLCPFLFGWGPILENHGMPLSLQISFFLYRKWHAIIFKNRVPGVI